MTTVSFKSREKMSALNNLHKNVAILIKEQVNSDNIVFDRANNSEKSIWEESASW